MTISIVNDGGRNRVKNTIFVKALLERKRLVVKKPFTSFDVDNWKDFCEICMKAYAECTRDSRGADVEKRIGVKITMPSGKVYTTSIWCDIAFNGMRYVSLD